jgi:hypothetical protein
MAFLGGVLKLARPIVGNIVRAVAPKAAEALKGIAGNVIKDLFSKGAGALKGLVSQLPIAGPLLGGLVDKLAPKLTDLAQRLAGTGIDRLLQMITGANTSRPLPGAQPGTTVTTPSINNPVRTETAATNAVPQSTTNASSGTGGTQQSNGGAPANTSFDAPAHGWSGGPPNPNNYGDLSKPENAQRMQNDMIRYQQTMSNIANFFQMLSSVLKAQSDTAGAIGRNLR